MKPEDGALVPDLDEEQLAKLVTPGSASDGAAGRRDRRARQRQAAGGAGQARRRPTTRPTSARAFLELVAKDPAASAR